MKKLNITGRLISHNIIKEEDAPIYEYGLQCMFLYIVNFFISVIIAIILNKLTICLLVYVFLFALRGYAGGFHFKNPWVCFVFSQFALILPQLLLDNIVLNKITSAIILMVLFFMLFMMIYKNNKQQPDRYTDEYLTRKNKIKSILLLIIYVITAFICMFINIFTVTKVILYSLSVQFLSLLIYLVFPIDKDNKKCHTID